MPAAFDSAAFERAIARLPRWILLLAVAGTVIAGSFFGIAAAGGFLAGSIAAWINLRIVERTVDRVARLSGTARPGGGAGTWLLIQFAGLILGAFVILRYSGFSMAAAFCGFLVCPAAVVLEIIYELVTYEHS
jgi:hypothetical protein